MSSRCTCGRTRSIIRQGYGSQAWVRENSVSQGLNNLRDQLQQAQAANQQAGKPGQGPGGNNERS